MLSFVMLAAVEDVPASAWNRFLEVVADKTPDLLVALLMLVCGCWLTARIRGFLLAVMTRRHVDVTLAKFLSELSYWLFIIVVIVTSLAQAGLQMTSIIAVVGAGALAIGLALQNSLSNFAAGVMIILFRHFRVGDFVEAGGVTGTVEEISIFNTILVTLDNRKVIVPNNMILSAPITNVLAKPTRRLDITFGISYESDIAKAKQVIMDAVREESRALPSPEPFIGVNNLGESSVDLLLQVWVGSADYLKLRCHLLETVKLRFDAAGIVIPYPQRDVHLIGKT